MFKEINRIKVVENKCYFCIYSNDEVSSLKFEKKVKFSNDFFHSAKMSTGK